MLTCTMNDQWFAYSVQEDFFFEKKLDSGGFDFKSSIPEW